MLPLAMFGMGGSEIIVILIVALLFLGPDKLPQAAKSISKGIRDIKKQSRALQNQIESDEQIGGAIRDLKSALRGEELPIRPKPYVPRPQIGDGAAAAGVAAGGAAVAELTAAEGAAAEGAAAEGATAEGAAAEGAATEGAAAEGAAVTEGATATASIGAPPTPAPLSLPSTPPTLKLSPTAGEPDPVEGEESTDNDDLASMIKPASGTVAKGS